jgi:hypothetical protein
VARVDAELLKKFFVDETPTGTVNGSNTTFTLSQTPFDGSDSVQVFLNGIKMDRVTHWTISGTTITFVTAPSLGQTVRVYYIMLRGEN